MVEGEVFTVKGSEKKLKINMADFPITLLEDFSRMLQNLKHCFVQYLRYACNYIIGLDLNIFKRLAPIHHLFV